VIFVATDKCWVRLDQLPDPAMVEIGALYGFSGTRQRIEHDLHELMLRSTYAELAPIFAALKTVAIKYRVPDAVHL